MYIYMYIIRSRAGLCKVMGPALTFRPSRLGTKKRLELFMAVCGAIQHHGQDPQGGAGPKVHHFGAV